MLHCRRVDILKVYMKNAGVNLEVEAILMPGPEQWDAHFNVQDIVKDESRFRTPDAAGTATVKAIP